MSDQKTNTGLQDRLRADANDSSEVEYLHNQFPHLTHRQIVEAVKSKGPMRYEIEKHLNAIN